MKLDFPLLILSDIHFGHPASAVRDPEQLESLFSGFETVLFNGDTVEMLTQQNRENAQSQVEEIGQLCLSQGAKPVFINGNHDPVISSANHLDLFGGSVLVTHGDILFHELAPWGREAAFMGETHTNILKKMCREALTDFDERLFAAREASISLEMHEMNYPQGKMAKLLTILRESWPPWRVLRIVKYWMQTPHRATMLAQIFRPFAKYVLIGHTHYAGIWESEGCTIINTGAFLPVSGRLGIVVEQGKMIVRKIAMRGKKYVLGKKLAEFTVEDRTEAKTPIMVDEKPEISPIFMPHLPEYASTKNGYAEVLEY